MFSFIISALKIIFLLGFLIFIHEGGHFTVAKLCKVKVNEFSIGFGPIIWKKQGKETTYSIRLIPLGGFVNMEGENEKSEDINSFSKASIPKRIAICFAGAAVNILFGLIVYFTLVALQPQYSIIDALIATKNLFFSMFDGLAKLFTGKIGVDQMMGPVGISETVAKTRGIVDFVELMTLISISLGVTNLLPIPALDGGKILILLIEAIRRKPLKEKTEINIQLIGFTIIIALSLYVTYNDVLRIF